MIVTIDNQEDYIFTATVTENVFVFFSTSTFLYSQIPF